MSRRAGQQAAGQQHQQQQQQQGGGQAAAPVINNSALVQPILMQVDEPFSISVQISGTPQPVVRWHVARKYVKEGSKYQMQFDGEETYTLVIASVKEEMDGGVWVVATNSSGEDSCMLDCKTFTGMLLFYCKFGLF